MAKDKKRGTNGICSSFFVLRVKRKLMINNNEQNSKLVIAQHSSGGDVTVVLMRNMRVTNPM